MELIQIASFVCNYPKNTYILSTYIRCTTVYVCMYVCIYIYRYNIPLNTKRRCSMLEYRSTVHLSSHRTRFFTVRHNNNNNIMHNLNACFTLIFIIFNQVFIVCILFVFIQYVNIYIIPIC